MIRGNAADTLFILREMAALFPGQDPIRTAAAFIDVSKHLHTQGDDVVDIQVTMTVVEEKAKKHALAEKSKGAH